MAANKQQSAFLYYRDWAEQTLALPKSLRLKIDDALKRYVLYGELPDEQKVRCSMFNLMRLQIDRDNGRYKDRCIKNADNARKRWNRVDDTNGNGRMQSDANDAYKEKEKDNDKDKETCKRECARSKFVIPTIDEVSDYISSKGLKADAAQFVDYYTANGWRVGRTPMRDWQAALRNWARRDTGTAAFSLSLKIADNEARPVYQAL